MSDVAVFLGEAVKSAIITYSLTILISATFVSLSCGQTKEELFRLNQKSYEFLGNHPDHVNAHWNRKGFQLVRRLQDGEFKDVTDKESIIAKLIKLHGDVNNPADVRKKVLKDTQRILNPEGITAEQIQSSHQRDTFTADQTIEIIGPDLARRIILSELPRTLLATSTMKETPEKFRTLIELEALATEIQFTPEQQAQFDAAIAAAENRYEEEIQEQRVLFRILSDEFFRNLLSILKPDQRKSLMEICGEPIWFFLEFDAPFFFGERNLWGVNRSKRAIFIGSNIPRDLDAKGKFVFEYDNALLGEMGYERYDKFVFDLLKSKFTRKWLRLDRKQQDQWSDFDNYLDENVICHVQPRGERLEELLEERAVYPLSLKRYLTAEQLADFRRLEYQARMMSRYSRSSLGSRFAPKNIELTNSQQSRLAAIYTEYRFSDLYHYRRDLRLPPEMRVLPQRVRGSSRASEAIKEIVETRYKIKQQLDASLKKILTDEQQDRFAKLTARPAKPKQNN